jgi:hypothetical protein
MRKLFLALLGGLLLPMTASATPAEDSDVVWLRACQGLKVASVSAGTYVCLTPDSDADDEVASNVLDVSSCENVDIFLHDDYDGDATACTYTWDIEMCPPGAGALATDALKNAACADLPGATDLSGDDVESNLAVQFLRVVGNNAGANPDSCRIVVKCAEGSSQ